MTIELRKAERKKAKLRIGVSAPSGGGKTYSSLLIAKGLVGDWKKIALIDTENGSGELYSNLGEYNVVTLEAPFSPEVYTEAIQTCEKAGMEAIIIDSATHEWDGKGGCLEIVESLGGRYQDWGKVTPRHRKFLESILTSPAHIITTTRRKQDYAMNQDQNGKFKVEKIGMKEVQREGFEYELTLAFDIDIRHNTKASKDRTGLFMDKPEFTITEETGKTLKDWAESGKDERIDKIEKIKELITKIGDPVTEKTVEFLNGKSLRELNAYVGVYEKKLEEVERKKATENDPAFKILKDAILIELNDAQVDLNYFEKDFGVKIADLKSGDIERAKKWITEYIDKQICGTKEEEIPIIK